jgi:hypothetical protein
VHSHGCKDWLSGSGLMEGSNAASHHPTDSLCSEAALPVQRHPTTAWPQVLGHTAGRCSSMGVVSGMLAPSLVAAQPFMSWDPRQVSFLPGKEEARTGKLGPCLALAFCATDPHRCPRQRRTQPQASKDQVEPLCLQFCSQTLPWANIQFHFASDLIPQSHLCQKRLPNLGPAMVWLIQQTQTLQK